MLTDMLIIDVYCYLVPAGDLLEGYLFPFNKLEKELKHVDKYEVWKRSRFFLFIFLFILILFSLFMLWFDNNIAPDERYRNKLKQSNESFKQLHRKKLHQINRTATLRNPISVSTIWKPKD
jgi:Na+-transporting methylmalonyl-CoA/oxaloacetate decarboxylase gamma subunit